MMLVPYLSLCLHIMLLIAALEVGTTDSIWGIRNISRRWPVSLGYISMGIILYGLAYWLTALLINGISRRSMGPLNATFLDFWFLVGLGIGQISIWAVSDGFAGSTILKFGKYLLLRALASIMIATILVFVLHYQG